MSWGLLLSFGLGGVGWTFAEYSIHNWVMHGGGGRNEFSRQHLDHHADPNFFSPIWGKYLTEALVVSAMLGLGTWLAGFAPALSFAAGFVVVYHSYEALHQRLHTHPPKGPVGRFLRRHHMTHHFVAPTKNHGVTFPLWDLAFGSYRKAPERIVIPARHAPRWLFGPAGGVRPEFAGDYGLRGGAVTAAQQAADRQAAYSNLAVV
ncbi:hypothetical protein EPO15_14815 [bacterium]|nr:MAG: hypothetical protein EPO15_14815 [bacterium]